MKNYVVANIMSTTNLLAGGRVLLLFSDAHGLCLFGVGSYR